MGAMSELEAVPAQTQRPAAVLGVRHLEMCLMFGCTTVAYTVRVSMSLGIVAMLNAAVLGVRHLEMCLMFGCTTVAYMVRVSMSLGIVAMTSPNQYGYPQFDWSKHVQDTVLSSFFWGYIVLQVPAGMLAARVGGKLLLVVGMATNGVISMLVPYAASQNGWMAVCACRMAMGLTQGLLFPSIHGLLGKWAPDCERARLSTFVYAGSQLGTVVEMMVAGVLSASAWGWPSVYYSVGALSLLWTMLWLVFGANSPATSRFISQEERLYIETNTGTDKSNKNLPIPWKKILTSMAFWSILLAHSGQSFGFWTLLTEMPSYMNHALGVDIKSNGLFSALPYLAMFVFSQLASVTSDFITNRRLLSNTNTRKLFNTIAHWGPAAALVGLAYLPAGHVSLAVTILTICVGLNGAHYTGFMMVHIDLAPNYASTMMGITNGASTIFSILAPLSVSFVIQDESMASEWRKVFFVSVAFYFLANLFFILFVTSERQSWNEPVFPEDMETETNDKKNKTRKLTIEGQKEQRF